MLRCVDERIGAADGVPGEHVRPRDMCGVQECVQVGRQLVTVLRSRLAAAPTFPGAVERTDARRPRHVPLHPCPVRRPLTETVEQNDRRRARTDAVEIETMAGDAVGATAW